MILKKKKNIVVNSANYQSKIADILQFKCSRVDNNLIVDTDYFNLSVPLKESFFNVYSGQLSDKKGVYEESLLHRILSMIIRRERMLHVLNDSELAKNYQLDNPMIKAKLNQDISELNRNVDDLMNKNSILSLDYLVDFFYFNEKLVIGGFSPLQIFSTEIRQAESTSSWNILDFSGLTNTQEHFDQVDLMKKRMRCNIVSSLYMDSSFVYIDEKVIDYLVSNRYNLLAICDQLCNMNMFADDISFNELATRSSILKSKLSKLANDPNNKRERFFVNTLPRSINELYEDIFDKYPQASFDIDQAYRVKANDIGIGSELNLSGLIVLMHIATDVRKSESSISIHVGSYTVEVDIASDLRLVRMRVEDIIKEFKNIANIHKAVIAILADAIHIEQHSYRVDLLKIIKFVKGVSW